MVILKIELAENELLLIQEVNHISHLSPYQGVTNSRKNYASFSYEIDIKTICQVLEKVAKLLAILQEDSEHVHYIVNIASTRRDETV